jgi:hypothetical protein
MSDPKFGRPGSYLVWSEQSPKMVVKIGEREFLAKSDGQFG